MHQTDFSSLKLQTALLDNLASLTYTAMTPIQAQSLPHILENNDVIGQAKTGSGKTVAFGLGILNKLDPKSFDIQSLVLCPTRELADQVAKELRKLARTIPNVKILTLCGGIPFKKQIESLQYGAHIVVGTPGRIEDHLRRETLNFNQLATLVLDEADRMLDMGFQPSLDAIVEQLPQKRQNLLFSATFQEKIQLIAKRIMHNPIVVEVESTHDADTIHQHFYKVQDNQRIEALRLLLLQHQHESTVVFCTMKSETQEIVERLNAYGFNALALNGDLEQKERDQALVRFANKSVSILVATDVASRGLDIDALDLVINYQVVRDPEIYVHRIGRTGRAGNKGLACTLFSDNESYQMSVLKDFLDIDIDMNGEPLPNKNVLNNHIERPAMITLQIDAGKKQKIRAGDIVGALTAGKDISGDQLGKIIIMDNWSFVAVKREVIKQALDKLKNGKLKGRSFRVRGL